MMAIPTSYVKRAEFRVKPGADAGSLCFPTFGCAAAARAPYAEYARQMTAGVILARRIERFTIDAECGFGRRAPETVAGLLKIHAEVCPPLP